jgi:autotransporter translocation and assembly factor TamB
LHPHLVRVGATLALLLTFLVALVGGALLHADLNPGRRIAGRALQRLLGGTLEGTVEVGPFESIGLGGAQVRDAVLKDAYGQRVLGLSHVRTDLPIVLLIRNVLVGQKPLSIIAEHVRVETADVAFLADPSTGEPTIVRALTPRPSASGPSSGPSTAPSIYLPSIEIGTVNARASLVDVPPLSAELKQVQGQLIANDQGLAVDVKRFGMVLRGFIAETRGTGTVTVRAPGPLEVTFEGYFGEVETKARAFLNGSTLDASIDIPSAWATDVRALVPDWPIVERVSAHVEAQGRLPALVVHANAQSLASTLEVSGPVILGSEPSALLTVTGRHLDVRLVDEEAPKTDVALDASVIAKTHNGKLTAEVHAHTEPAIVSEQLVPAVDGDGTWDGEKASGTLHIDEPGVPTDATFELTKAGVFDLDAKVNAVDLQRLPRLGIQGVTGRGHAHARLHVEGGQVRGTYDADVTGLSLGVARVPSASVKGEVSAPLRALEVARFTAHLQGKNATLGSWPLGNVKVDATGDAKSVALDAVAVQENGPEIRGKGRLSLRGGAVLSQTKLSLRRDPVLVEGTVDRLDFDEGIVDVHDVRVTGAGGELKGAIRLAHELVEIEAQGDDVDLDALSRAIGLPRGTIGGKLRVNADVAAGRDVTRGRLRLGLTDATVGAVGGLSLDLSGDLEDRALTGGATGMVAGIGTFGGTWNVTLAGKPFEVDSYRNATGTAELQVGNIRLPLVSALLPANGLVGHVSGTAYVRALVERRDAKATLPNFLATVQTQGLAVDLRTGEPPLHVQGIDVTMTGALDGTTGDSTGTTLLADAHGDLLTATGAIHLDVERFLSEPERALAQLLDTPFDAVVTVPARSIDLWPDFARVPGIAGTVSANGTVRGTLSHPTFYASATGTQIAAAEGGLSKPVDVGAEARYDWDTRTANARVTTSLAGTQVATATLRAVLPESGIADVNASGRLDVFGLPLDVFGTVANTTFGGLVYGFADFSKQPGSGAVSSNLRILQTTVDQAPLGEAQIQIDATRPLALATIQVSGDRGTLEGQMSAPVSFAHFAPALVPTDPVRVKVTAKDFSAALLAPAVNGVLSRVAGRLDAELSVELDPEPDADGATEWVGGASGTAALSEGSAFIEPLGMDVRGLSFALTANGQGKKTDVTVRDLGGRVRSTNDNVHGSLDLELSGLSLVSGTGELRADDMPILLQGAPQGRATGHATAKLEGTKEAMLVDVQVPDLTVTLPASSTRAVIDLRAHPDLIVLQDSRKTGLTDTPRLWRLTLHLGSNVRIRRSDVDLGVFGDPMVEFGGPETRMTGTVDLRPGGRVPLLGKVFVIDQGHVEFGTGDPANPRVDVRAVWRAANDTQVIVQVSGTLRDNQVALRSEPALPQSEVFALLLGGSSSDTTDYDSDAAKKNSGSAAGSVALGSGVSALGLNDLLTNNPVELRVETTSQSLPRYTASVRIRENLWFEASTYQRTDVGVGAAANRNVYSGTVDYRFTDKWSLRTEAGTAGGAMDLLWQYRY